MLLLGGITGCYREGDLYLFLLGDQTENTAKTIELLI